MGAVVPDAFVSSIGDDVYAAESGLFPEQLAEFLLAYVVEQELPTDDS